MHLYYELFLRQVAAADLIAGHCGQTAPKTVEACRRAYGGKHQYKVFNRGHPHRRYR